MYKGYVLYYDKNKKLFFKEDNKMPAMDPKIENILNQYYDKFNASFPLFQANSQDEAAEHAIKCINNNKTAAQMWPDQYGECNGKYF